MRITNPFSVFMAVTNVIAAVYEVVKNHDWRMAGIFICYATASALLGIGK